MKNILKIIKPFCPVIFASAIFLVSCSFSDSSEAFFPGRIWEDTDGVHINAHGGGILYHDGI